MLSRKAMEKRKQTEWMPAYRNVLHLTLIKTKQEAGRGSSNFMRESSGTPVKCRQVQVFISSLLLSELWICSAL